MRDRVKHSEILTHDAVRRVANLLWFDVIWNKIFGMNIM